MYTLYHCLSARSFRPLWVFEEMGLEYELIVLPFPPRVLKKDFLAINSLGTVPAFRDGAVFMTESAAICQYLADRNPDKGLAVASDSAEYGNYVNWLHFGEATLTFPQTLVLRYGTLEPSARRQPQVVEDYSRWFLARLRRPAEVLGQRPYLCGETFTVADISVGYALMLAESLGLAKQFPETLTAYWSRLKTREGYKRALDAQLRAAKAQSVSTVLVIGSA